MGKKGKSNTVQAMLSRIPAMNGTREKNSKWIARNLFFHFLKPSRILAMFIGKGGKNQLKGN
jgi:hypothetical protein